LLDAYPPSAGLTTPGSFYTVANIEQTSGNDAGGECSLDVGFILLRTKMDAGHGGAAGRVDRPDAWR